VVVVVRGRGCGSGGNVRREAPGQGCLGLRGSRWGVRVGAGTGGMGCAWLLLLLLLLLMLMEVVLLVVLEVLTAGSESMGYERVGGLEGGVGLGGRGAAV